MYVAWFLYCYSRTMAAIWVGVILTAVVLEVNATAIVGYQLDSFSVPCTPHERVLFVPVSPTTTHFSLPLQASPL